MVWDSRRRRGSHAHHRSLRPPPASLPPSGVFRVFPLRFSMRKNPVGSPLACPTRRPCGDPPRSGFLACPIGQGRHCSPQSCDRPQTRDCTCHRTYYSHPSLTCSLRISPVQDASVCRYLGLQTRVANLRRCAPPTRVTPPANVHMDVGPKQAKACLIPIASAVTMRARGQRDDNDLHPCRAEIARHGWS